MLPLESIRNAARLIGNRIIRTPLVFSPSLSRRFDVAVYLKLENLQKTGSFKIRGATHKLLTCRDQIGPDGVVAASAGNHAQRVALAHLLTTISRLKANVLHIRHDRSARELPIFVTRVVLEWSLKPGGPRMWPPSQRG